MDYYSSSGGALSVLDLSTIPSLSGCHPRGVPSPGSCWGPVSRGYEMLFRVVWKDVLFGLGDLMTLLWLWYSVVTPRIFTVPSIELELVISSILYIT